MRRFPATVASLRPFPLVSLLVAALLTAIDLAAGATGGLLLLAAFLGVCALAVGDRVRRATDRAAVPGTIGGPGGAEGEVAAHDGGIAARIGSLRAAGKAAK